MCGSRRPTCRALLTPRPLALASVLEDLSTLRITRGAQSAGVQALERALASMPPKLVAEGGQVVIRPLTYAAEEDLASFADAKSFPIIPCDLCGSQDGLQRKIVGRMISDWERERLRRGSRN